MTSRKPSVAVLDYGSGNLRSAQRALQRAGADAEVTTDPAVALRTDGLVVPGVGAYAACMAGLQAAGGDQVIAKRLAGARPVLGICVGMQVLFEAGEEHGQLTQGCGWWPGVVRRIAAPVLPHMGWNVVARRPAESRLLAGIDEDAMFYFVHSYAATQPIARAADQEPPGLGWTSHGEDFISLVEDGPLTATQFHPEKSSDAGAVLLANWLEMLR